MNATPIGTVSIVGLGEVGVSISAIDFAPTILVTGARGSYAPVLFTTGTIADLIDPPTTPGAPLPVPFSPFVAIPIPGGGSFIFNVEEIFLGGAVPCTPRPGVGGSCTPSEYKPNSPFVLTQLNSSVSVSFSLRGRVLDTRDGSRAPYTGLFSANLTAPEVNTIDKILTALATPPGVVQSSWSASFTSVPEPGTALLLGAGLICLGVAGRWRSRRR